MTTPKHLLAYFDTFAGLVPCRVFGVKGSKADGGDADIQITCTATHGAYKRGERLEVPSRHVWPRDTSFRKRGSYGQRWIVPAYDWSERLAR